MQEAAESPWRCLRVPLAIFAVTVLAGAGATGAAWWHEQGAVERSNEAAARLTEARRRYAALGDERRQWRHLGRLYRLWASHGGIGDGDATRWADAVRVASAEVAGASHRLGMPRGAEHDGGIEVRAFDMSVELGMRHEGELPDFLSVLEREARGLFVVSGCRLVRSGSGGTGPPKRPAIDASCRLRWMTVTLSGVEPGWTPPRCGRRWRRCRGRRFGVAARYRRRGAGSVRPALHDGRRAGSDRFVRRRAHGRGKGSRENGQSPASARAVVPSGPLGGCRRAGRPIGPLGLRMD